MLVQKQKDRYRHSASQQHISTYLVLSFLAGAQGGGCSEFLQLIELAPEQAIPLGPARVSVLQQKRLSVDC